MDLKEISYTQQLSNDFDEIAELPELAWNSNIHYHPFVLKNLPRNCRHILDIGCGKGSLCRKMIHHSQNITGIDLSQKMIEKARGHSGTAPKIKFKQADYLNLNFPEKSIDAIVSVATVHHINMEKFVDKAKKELRPGGRLLIVDLYQEEKWSEKISSPFASGLSTVFNIIYNKRIHSTKKEQEYWIKHGQNDKYLPIDELKNICATSLPGAILKRRFFWRYTLVWQKTFEKL